MAVTIGCIGLCALTAFFLFRALKYMKNLGATADQKVRVLHEELGALKARTKRYDELVHGLLEHMHSDDDSEKAGDAYDKCLNDLAVISDFVCSHERKAMN